MALDFSLKAYVPRKMGPQKRTSYGVMSQWMKEFNHNARPKITDSIVPIANRSQAFAKSRNNPVNRNGAPGPYVTQSLIEQKPGCLVKQAAVDKSLPVHMRYTTDCGYDDFHRASRSLSQNWPMAYCPVYGPPLLRYGRAGGNWRHVKEVLQAGGSRHVFVDGRVSLDDTNRLDEVPGGHLILPDAETTQKYKDEIDYNMETEELLQKFREQKQQRTNTYGVEDQRGLEKYNWNVMR